MLEQADLKKKPPLAPPSLPIAVPRAANVDVIVVGGGGADEDEQEEEEYGTPKSECSFVSAFSSVSAAAAAAATANGGGAGAGEGVALAPASSSSTSSVPLLERVRRLEAALPGHAARARAQASSSRGASASASASAADLEGSKRLSAAADRAEQALRDGRGTLLMRVAQLEAALGALVEAEAALLAARGKAAEKSRVACCSVM